MIVILIKFVSTVFFFKKIHNLNCQFTMFNNLNITKVIDMWKDVRRNENNTGK